MAACSAAASRYAAAGASRGRAGTVKRTVVPLPGLASIQSCPPARRMRSSAADNPRCRRRSSPFPRGGRVEATPVVAYRADDRAVVAIHLHPGAASVGMLAHVEKRLAHDPIDELLGLRIQANVAHAAPWFALRLAARLVREIAQRGAKPLFVQQRWAQLKRQPTCAFERIVDRRSRGVHVGRHHPRRRKTGSIKAHDGRGEHLNRVVGEFRREHASLLLLGAQHRGHRLPARRFGAFYPPTRRMRRVPGRSRRDHPDHGRHHVFVPRPRDNQPERGATTAATPIPTTG
jgi:hypothetical protein